MLRIAPPRHRPVPVVTSRWPAVAPPPHPPTSEPFIRAAAHAGRWLDAVTYDTVVDLGTDTAGPGAVVLRGVPVGDVPPTPPTPTTPTGKDHVSEMSLLTVARLLGQPVGYLPEHGGDVIQNILPTATDVGRQTSTSSRVELAFHTETAFHPHKPRYLLLLCLRGDPAAATTLCCVDDVLDGLSPAHRTLLREPRFHTRADESFGGGPDSAFGPPIAVLTGAYEHPALTFDAELTSGVDDEAQQALDALGALVTERHASLVLEAGDLLIVDNERCVHGRSPFAARFDGTDRWLQRTFVVADLSPSAAERAGRVITTTF